MRTAPVLTTFLLLSTPTAVSTAEPPPSGREQPAPPRVVRLDYSHGPGAKQCPEPQAFRDAIGVHVARELFAPDAATRLVVLLSRRGAGYEGVAELRDAAGVVSWSKVLPGPNHPPAATCASLIEGLAFAASIELEPATFPDVAPPTLTVLPPSLAPLPSSPLVPSIEKEEKSPEPFRLGVSPWLDLGAAPRQAFGLSFDIGFRLAWFSLDLEGRWDPPAGSVIKGAEVSTSRFVGALVPCGHAWYFAGCLLGEVGPIWSSVTGAGIHGDTQSVAYIAIGGRLSLEFPIAPHLALRPAVDLLLALQRPSLHVAATPRFEVPLVGAGFGLGLLASF